LEDEVLKALHRFWPQGWWPDQRTLGLLIFGFFAASAASTLAYSAPYVSLILNLQTPNESSYVAPWFRLTSGATLLGGAAELIAALGGLALMANLPRARVVTAAGVGIACATVVFTLVVAPLGFGIYSLADAILDIAIVVLVMRWQPQRASGTPSVSTGSSTVDDTAEAARPSG
jgi:hypothetical protein